MTNQTNPPRSELRWDARRRKLTGTLMGVPAMQTGRPAYQGELVTGDVVTVYWDGTCDQWGTPYLYKVDTNERVSGDNLSYRWFNTLAAVSA